MKFIIKKFNPDYHLQSIELLNNDLSKYLPKNQNYNEILQNFLKQENVFSYVALFEKEVVGYGSLIIETKIRGDKIGHIEDIVTKKVLENRMLVGNN